MPSRRKSFARKSIGGPDSRRKSVGGPDSRRKSVSFGQVSVHVFDKVAVSPVPPDPTAVAPLDAVPEAGPSPAAASPGPPRRSPRRSPGDRAAAAAAAEAASHERGRLQPPRPAVLERPIFADDDDAESTMDLTAVNVTERPRVAPKVPSSLLLTHNLKRESILCAKIL